LPLRLVLLPEAEYRRLLEDWGLPDLPTPPR
jgi:hypothetical protein